MTVETAEPDNEQPSQTAGQDRVRKVRELRPDAARYNQRGIPIPRAHDLSLTFRGYLWLEMSALFLAAPLALWYAVHIARLPLFQVLPALLIPTAFILLVDGRFIWRKIVTTWFSFGELLHILGTFLILGSLLAWYALQIQPGRFLYFPERRPDLWLLVMTFYPVLSVTVQEVLCRVFFFHRYGPLLENRAVLLITLNAALFGYAHIIFQNWPAVWISAIGGVLFAVRYWRTRSFWAVWLEHSLYGNLIFTIGFGSFFFTGVSNTSAMPTWREVVGWLSFL